MSEHLLDVQNLHIRFRSGRRDVPAVDGVSFHVDPGETLCLVGESGAGKSVTGLSVMGLLPSTATTDGEVRFAGENVLRLSEPQLQELRGDRVSMIFQEPMTSLNPVLSIEDQISETIFRHRGGNKQELREQSTEALAMVGIPNPARRMKEYPHQLSGGMRQRVMIAMALACGPDLLIADEPTTALDVSIQAQILNLIFDLKKRLGTGVLFITHDLGVVAQIADRVAVMYAGQIVEHATVETLFEHPRHPYTEGLLGTIPTLEGTQERLQAIEGTVPDIADLPSACRFHPRCPHRMDICTREDPGVYERDGATVRCWLYEEKRGLA